MSVIQVTPTPNPNSMKLTVAGAAPITEGMEFFRSAEEATGHPLGERLFSLPEVANVFITPEFVTVTKHPEADWDALLPRIEAILQEYLAEAGG